MIHTTYDNKRLARELDSIEKLKEAPELQKYLKWIRKQKSGRTFKTRSRKS